MKHKWHDEIVAWAGGAEIEAKEKVFGEWLSINDVPNWNEERLEFRIKPQPKEKKYLYVYYRDKVYFLQDKDASNRYYIGKIEVQDV
jgi:hypothetical protein